MPQDNRSILVVIHGMGKHDANTIQKTVEACGQTLLERYPTTKDKQFVEHVEVIPVGYDDIFEDERKRIAENNQTISSYIASHSTLPGKAIQKLVSIEGAIGTDTFLTTHLLDVVLYASLHSEIVRLRVAEKIAKAIKISVASSRRPVHILAHSLGSMVAHDTLAKLYSNDGGFRNSGNDELASFIPNQSRLKSLWMVANVSNLMYSLNFLNTNLNPWDSVVKPARDNSGCTQYFYNVHHVVDPFTLFHRFDPSIDDDWVTARAYQRNYVPIQINKFTSSLNPHSLSNYLTNPCVGNCFLGAVMPTGEFNVSEEEAAIAHRNIPELIQGAEEVRDRFSQIDSVDDLKSVLKLMKDYLEFVRELADE
jgi:hypothetical protein